MGTWKGGVCGLISLANEDKDIDIYACDTFSGVKNASNKDTFLKMGNITIPLQMIFLRLAKLSIERFML